MKKSIMKTRRPRRKLIGKIGDRQFFVKLKLKRKRRTKKEMQAARALEAAQKAAGHALNVAGGSVHAAQEPEELASGVPSPTTTARTSTPSE